MRRCQAPMILGIISSILGSFFVDRSAFGQGEWGSVKGRIIYDGKTVPTRPPLNVTKDEQHCLMKGPILSDEWVVNAKNNGVRWVFVWLAPDQAGAALKVHPDLLRVPDKKEMIDQPCCAFIPHALGIREGQAIEAKNSAPIVHNVHWTGHPLKNPGNNQIVPANQSLLIEGLKADRYPVEIKCDIHPWMKAWVRVFDHPYFAVTDEDGRFEMKLAPAGAYRLIVWHDSGWGPGGRDGIPIVIKGGMDTDIGEHKMK